VIIGLLENMDWGTEEKSEKFQKFLKNLELRLKKRKRE
jgi:hypothetical protein